MENWKELEEMQKLIQPADELIQSRCTGKCNVCTVKVICDEQRRLKKTLLMLAEAEKNN